MIYDCFTFFNELDLLELRLNVLSPVVDYFVIVESTRTHQNGTKPLYYSENRERFAAFQDRIIHIAHLESQMPRTVTPWNMQRVQRNQIVRGLGSCRPDDLIILSDADEIPNPDAIKLNTTITSPVCFSQDLFYYFLNFRCIESRIWNGSRMFPFSSLTKPHDMRRLDCPKIMKGGWHFSYLGGVSKVIQKIESFAGWRYNFPEYKNPDTIARCLREGLDIFGRNLHFEKVPVDSTFPQYLLRHMEKYRDHLI